MVVLSLLGEEEAKRGFTLFIQGISFYLPQSIGNFMRRVEEFVVQESREVGYIQGIGVVRNRCHGASDHHRSFFRGGTPKRETIDPVTSLLPHKLNEGGVYGDTVGFINPLQELGARRTGLGIEELFTEVRVP